MCRARQHPRHTLAKVWRRGCPFLLVTPKRCGRAVLSPRREMPRPSVHTSTPCPALACCSARLADGWWHMSSHHNRAAGDVCGGEEAASPPPPLPGSQMQ
eukprot:360850-Chlamydomonas_euryale.AAC.2